MRRREKLREKETQMKIRGRRETKWFGLSFLTLGQATVRDIQNRKALNGRMVVRIGLGFERKRDKCLKSGKASKKEQRK